ncbi:zinc-binding dehydrogenase [Pseudonocardia sp. ICBG1034]|uniref:zinc-binding dehydrogenase n=1 Tax=Pseudonocardia sp. ICBG1034 TaxID=2844381 RepID=UPI001CCF529F|nr:zinc-binding dehydrogenase [Pseudonocardia sp. ICBG1034]
MRPGDVVAVWGAGGVGQMAARAAMVMGAERVVVVDRYDNRLKQVRTHIGAETLDHEEADVPAELREMTGGRGPDVCIEAVGTEAHHPGPQYLYDQAKQQMRLQTDRPTAVREAIHACHKGGTVLTLGVFVGVVDKLPLGAVMNKALTFRGAQQHGQRYLPETLDLTSRDEVRTRTPRHSRDAARRRSRRLPDVQGEGGRVRPRGVPPGRVTGLDDRYRYGFPSRTGSTTTIEAGLLAPTSPYTGGGRREGHRRRAGPATVWWDATGPPPDAVAGSGACVSGAGTAPPTPRPAEEGRHGQSSG